MNEKIQNLIRYLNSKGAVILDGSVKGAIALEVRKTLFSQAAKILKEAGFRLAAEWASDETLFDYGFSVYAAFNDGSDYLILKSVLPPGESSFPTLTKLYPGAYRLERQIESLFGLIPGGHPDLRPWIKHEDWPAEAYPLRKSFQASTVMPRVEREYKWAKAQGEGVFEIPVGPVHAGIIEPGHFRFQSVGEDIINLETRLGYVHKGIEKRFESLSWEEAVRLSGRVSGDSTVAHAVAFCMAAEEASGCVPTERARYLRAVMMELERLSNHLGDIGAVCNDTAFAFLHYQLSVLREKVLRASKKAFGHRLLMDRVILSGVSADIDAEGVEAVVSVLDEVSVEFERLVRIYEDNPSLEDRVFGTGVLKPDVAEALGVVGFVARSSGQRLDVRVQSPFTPYDRFVPKAPLLKSGDVHARTWVRIEEARESLRLIRDILGALPEGPIASGWVRPLPGQSGFSAVEGWRGEIIYWVQSAPDRSINRCMVRDPSSMNWLAIEQAIRGNIVPDFPLCNKSFNQSYSGHDL